MSNEFDQYINPDDKDDRDEENNNDKQDGDSELTEFELMIQAVNAKHGASIQLQENDSLRPNNLDDFIGQRRIKNTLQTTIRASMIRARAAPHILASGPAGHGKTTLAYIIADMRDVPLTSVLASGVTSVNDLVDPIVRSGDLPGRVIFIDEIHRLSPRLQEVLYPMMEDFKTRVRIGSGRDSYTEEVQLYPFTLIGGTTQPGRLAKPLKDRFGIVLRLTTYTVDELQILILRNSVKVDMKIDEPTAKMLAGRCRFSPRQANHLLTYCRDLALTLNKDEIDDVIVEQGLMDLGVDELGLTPDDRQVLDVISSKFDGGPVGVNSIAVTTDLDEENIISEVEPILLIHSLLERTPKGRKITLAGLEHLALTKDYD